MMKPMRTRQRTHGRNEYGIRDDDTHDCTGKQQTPHAIDARRASEGAKYELAGGNASAAFGFDMSQHAWLLAPLRDLSVNWEVDLAGDLSEYLEVLGELEFTFDDGNTTLNFAEAALLIQGSACVYSKKVEYLHSLVYNALEVISTKKRKEAGPSQAELDDIDLLLNDDENDHFLNLDDYIEEAEDIDLDELKAKQYTSNVTPSTTLRTNVAALHLSTQAPVGPDAPAGAASDVLMMSNTYVHHSGALLLQKGDLVRLDCELMPSATDVAQAIEVAAVGRPDDDIFDDTLDAEYESSVMVHDKGTNEADEMPMMEEQIEAHGNAVSENRLDEEDFDPYIPLDPYDTTTMSKKPFKRASTKLKARTNVNDKSLILTTTRGEIPLAKMTKGPTYKEFDYAFKDECLRENKSGAKELKLLKHQSMHATDGFDPLELELEEAGVDQEDIMVRGLDELDDNLEIPDDTYDFEMPVPMEDLNDTCDGDSPAVSYEALCRQHIDRIIQAAAAEEVRSELAQRVCLWQTKIEPALEEAENRPIFDIRLYEKDIIDSIGKSIHLEKDSEGVKVQNGHPVVMFKKVVHGVSRHEICRIFAATLQLINDGNVKLLQDRDCTNELELELQSPAEAFMEIDKYLAPTAQARVLKSLPTENAVVSETNVRKMKVPRTQNAKSISEIKDKENAFP